MNVCIAASEGGHLTETQYLDPAFAGHDRFVISYRCPRVEAMAGRVYMLNPFPDRHPYLLGPFWLLGALWAVARAFRKERPGAVVSTGSEIAIPVFLVAFAYRVPTAFIETITRFENATVTGRWLYRLRLSDRFFVQNRESLVAYGPKAEFHGGVV